MQYKQYFAYRFRSSLDPYCDKTFLNEYAYPMLGHEHEVSGGNAKLYRRCYELKSVEFSTKFPSLNLPFVRTDPFFNKPFPFIGLALGGVFGRDGLHEPVDHIGFDQIVRESGMLVVDSFD